MGVFSLLSYTYGNVGGNVDSIRQVEKVYKKI